MNKKLLLIPALLMTVGCAPKEKGEPVDLTESIFNTNMIHYLGRTNVVENEYVQFAMTSSGFEIKINVTDTVNNVKATMASYADQGGPSQFAYVFVDGVEPENKLALSHLSDQTYTLTSNLSLGEHTIRFVKLNEGAFTNIKLKDLTVEGATWKQWTKKYEKKIEFMGDSITCGYGSDGVQTDPFSLIGENGVHTYAYQCAKELDYDFSFVSESGMSIAMNAFGSSTYFKDIYKTYDCVHAFDYENYPIDIAVIALGTNDNTAFASLSHNEQLNKIELILQAYKDLGDTIMKNNPNAQIFFIYNLMVTQNGLIDTAIRGACNYLNEKYDEIAYYMEFTPDHAGGSSHPGKEAHLRDGHLLAEFIKNPSLPED